MIKNILRKADISRRHFNYLLNGDRNATAATAKRLELATGISREVWVFGSSMQRKKAIKKVLREMQGGSK